LDSGVVLIADGTFAPFPTPLNIRKTGSRAVLSWSNSAFVLQSAPFAIGTFTNIPGAISPFTNVITGPQRYFRLKAN